MKKLKLNKIITYDNIDLKYMSASEVADTIIAAIQKYGKDKVSFDVSYQQEYGDSCCGTCDLTCEREETAEEESKRKEQAARVAKEQEARQHANYLLLKKKYEAL